jgi:hypothetical protein
MADVDKTPSSSSSCGKHEDLVSYLYKEATPEETRLFESHLSGCSACRDEIAAFERVRDQLQQWQVADLPVLRVVAGEAQPTRSFLAILKELFTVMPVWVKLATVAAMAIVVLSATGIRISIGRDGFALSSRFEQKPPEVVAGVPVQQQPRGSYARAEQLEQLRADLSALVTQKIADSERLQRDQVRAELVSLQADLKNLRSADLARIVARVQEHQSRLATIERDLDRREGSDITDLLFSELTTKENRTASSASRGD